MPVFPPSVALYRVRAGRVRVRSLRAGGVVGECDEEALIAHQKTSGRILATGDAALRWCGVGDAEVVRLFAHPRVVVHDIDATERLLLHLTARAFGREGRAVRGRWWRPLDVAFHFEEGVAGGLTDVEKRGLTHIARSHGARSLAVCDHAQPLSDGELSAIIVAGEYSL